MTLHADRSDPTVARLLDAVGARQKRVYIEGAEHVVMNDTFWDGGTRSTYHAVDLATGRKVTIPNEAPPAFGGDTPMTAIPEGVALVRVTQTWPRDYVTIYVRPDNLTKLLPSPEGLPEDEAIVLCYTCALKNSYGGETDIRFKRARRTQGITRERWDAATASLKAKKMLNAAGVITTSGRNAVEGHPLRYRAH